MAAFALLVVAFTLFLSVHALDFNGSLWIWTDEVSTPGENAPIGARAFRKSFTAPLGKTPVHANVLITVDNIVNLFVNGAAVGSGQDFRFAESFCVALRPCLNVIAVVGNNTGGPAGLLAAVEVVYSDGSSGVFYSDASWRYAPTNDVPEGFESLSYDDAAWPTVITQGKEGVAPWGQITIPTNPRTLALTKSSWIWTNELSGGIAPVGSRFFRKTYTPPAGMTASSARIAIAADNAYELFVNGKLTGSGTSFTQAQTYTVDLGSAPIVVFAVNATNASGPGPNPAGLIAVVQITSESQLYGCDCCTDGAFLITDGSWKYSISPVDGFEGVGYDDSAWPFVVAEAEYAVLKASVHDLRYFATLLRGVNFANRATVTITQTGFVVVVEEARTLLGTAYIFADIFDEYTYHSESEPPINSQPSDGGDDDDSEDNAAFEIPLNTLIECLNIFGTAGSSGGANGAGGGRYTKWKRGGDSDNEGGGGDDDDGNDRRKSKGKGIDQYFGGSDKGTGMRMTYLGSGFPLTLLIMEDSSGPTTTCEITTYEAEPHLQLPFENERMVLKIILKSSWLREALSEIDPSCEKLTFIGHPPPNNDPLGRQRAPLRSSSVPLLRIQASGTFGSTEMEYPNDREVLETFECTQPVRFSYRVGHISRTLRALQSSTKTSLRIDDEGLLSLQFLMPAPPRNAVGGKPEGSSDGFIEFRCLPLDDEVY
ncbi:hypothetical protein HMN09_00102400 [Mycena chlorophos]|uniref:Uncharacterized protein n=1 Tax=Mycena chlorophos TaxID=658473 RepID=A0A8H6TUY7_MYCCL|nr:hypothetical protein HMN09_00102400 [Mycena chlorophos]